MKNSRFVLSIMSQYVRNFQNNQVYSQNFQTTDELNLSTCDSDLSKFRILHNNIRSIDKNFDELNVVLSQLNFKPDCIILSETWKISDVNKYCLDGYCVIYNNGTFNKNDGVIAFVNGDLRFDFEVIRMGEIEVVVVDITKYNIQIQVIALYRSPSGSIAKFNEDLGILLDNCRKKKKYDMSFFVGDINVDILGGNSEAEEYLNVMSEYGYESMINDYTRVTTISKSCLDHIFVKTNFDLEMYKSGILQTSITDHYITFIEFASGASINDHEKEPPWKKKYINYKNMKKILEEESWDVLYNTCEVDVAWTLFTNRLQEIIENCTKTIKIKKSDRKRKPWITRGIIVSIKRKDQLYKDAIKHPTNYELLRSFKTHKNILEDLIKCAKRNYYRKEIDKNKNYSRGLWKIVNEKKKNNIAMIESETGQLLKGDKSIADEFNRYFINVACNLANKISPNQKSISRTRHKHFTSIVFFDTDEKEIESVIKILKNNKAPGPDGIKAETLKKISTYVIAPLKYLINQSIKTGIFPTILKNATVIPVHKNSDRLKLENYRPISLTSTMSKVFEKILYKRIISFVEKHKLIAARQYGFQKGRSSQEAMAELVSLITEAIDNKMPAVCVFVDLAKAFDTVDHVKLLDTLEKIGWRGVAYSLMETYLKGRKQRVKIGKVVSEEKVNTCGVPQGTILGPVLFLLYIDDLFTLSAQNQIVSFADDTVVLYTAPTWNSLKLKIEEDFTEILEFLNSRKLTVNMDKTRFMSFTSLKSGKPTFQVLTVKNGDGLPFQVRSAEKIKYLGIMVDSHLKWQEQSKLIVHKVRSLISRIKSLKNICELDELMKVYYALVEPHLSYGVLVWGGMADFYYKQVEVIQKWIIKIIYGKPITYPTEKLYELSRVCSVRQLHGRALLSYQHNQGIPPKDYMEIRGNHLQLPKIKKTVAQRSFIYLAPLLYNQLPVDIKETKNNRTFNRRVKTWIKSKPKSFWDTFTSRNKFV